MNTRPRRARAATKPSFGSLANDCTLPDRSPSGTAMMMPRSTSGGEPLASGDWRAEPLAAKPTLEEHQLSDHHLVRNGRLSFGRRRRMAIEALIVNNIGTTRVLHHRAGPDYATTGMPYEYSITSRR